jgi:hypothetical protein
MTRPRLYVALPWLDDLVRDVRERLPLAELPALAWLASRGTLAPVKQASWRHWLLEAGGGHADAHHTLMRFAAGPCVARLAQLASDTVAGWACAQPVHLAAAMDHLRLAPLQQAQLTTTDRAALAASINTHFSDRGFKFDAFVDNTWLLRSMSALDCQSHDPALVAGHNIHDYMPSGPDGAYVRSLMNEIQMVLHEHPVNESRARRNEPVINALWLWGFGAPLPAEQCVASAPLPINGLPALRDVPLLADDAWLRGIWHVHGRETTVWTPRQPAPDLARDSCIAVSQPPAGDTTQALVEIDGTLLAPLRSALAAGDLDGIELLIGSRVLHIEASARFKFWKRADAARLQQ